MAEKETLGIIERFNVAFNRHDVDEVMSLMTEDVVFESTGPAPDGDRVKGSAAVRAYWEDLFRTNPNAHFDTEDIFAAGDRCTVRWRFTFDSERPEAGHVRGVDVFRVRDGRVAEKLSYVKG